MIKLNVKDYCHDCPQFVADSETLWMNGENLTYVMCGNRKECQQIEQYLRAKKATVTMAPADSIIKPMG